VGLEDFTYAKPYELSGGMKQRASLARVLVNEPSVILMDEPLCALDAFTRINMQVFIRDIWRKIGMTTLLITHDIDEALSLGSRVIVLSKRPGRIIGMFDSKFSQEDDELRASSEYVSMRRKIFDLIDTSTVIQGSKKT
jgi:taurine transport system ATP-binding protein